MMMRQKKLSLILVSCPFTVKDALVNNGHRPIAYNSNSWFRMAKISVVRVIRVTPDCDCEKEHIVAGSLLQR